MEDWGHSNGLNGSAQIYGNAVGTPSAGSWGNDWIANSFGSSQFSQATIVGILVNNNIWYVGVRILPQDGTSSTTGYFAGTFGGAGEVYRIDRWDNGVRTGLATSAQVAALNDVVNLQIIANQLTLFVNGISILTVADSTYATGNVGFVLQTLTFTTGFLDDWSGGDLALSAIAEEGYLPPLCGSGNSLITVW